MGFIGIGMNMDSAKNKSIIAALLITGLVLGGCNTAPSDTSEITESSIQTEVSETAETSETTEVTETAETTKTTTASSESSEDTEDTDILPSGEETTIDPNRNVGYGSYGFMIGDLEFHSQSDISMLVQAEDPTVYDFGARDISCKWIDIYYYESTFGMIPFDGTYRFLSFYNNDTSISFSGYKQIGTWTTPKGSTLDMYLTEITIISDNLEIHILPEQTKPENYDVSICGRGYYVSEQQLQMADFVLGCLYENPGVDPLEGVIGGVNHTYYF